ncbi:unnamed protein product [Urochloa humidicola]
MQRRRPGGDVRCLSVLVLRRPAAITRRLHLQVIYVATWGAPTRLSWENKDPLHMLAAFHYREKKLAIFIWFMGYVSHHARADKMFAKNSLKLLSLI